MPVPATTPQAFPYFTSVEENNMFFWSYSIGASFNSLMFFETFVDSPVRDACET